MTDVKTKSQLEKHLSEAWGAILKIADELSQKKAVWENASGNMKVKRDELAHAKNQRKAKILDEIRKTSPEIIELKGA